jgi:hypothetical protein
MASSCRIVAVSSRVHSRLGDSHRVRMLGLDFSHRVGMLGLGVSHSVHMLGLDVSHRVRMSNDHAFDHFDWGHTGIDSLQLAPKLSLDR